MSAASSAGESEQALQQAAARAASHLASLQSSEGLWPNLFQAGPYLDVLHALGSWFLHRKNHPLQPPHGEAWARRILSSQHPDGGFPLWHGGPSDPRYGIETYLALRLAGLPAPDPGLRALGRTIARHGGLKEAGGNAWIKLLWAGATHGQSGSTGAPEHYYFLDYQRWPARTRQELVCLASLSIACYLRGEAPVAPPADPPRLEKELPPPEEPATGPVVGFDLRGITSLLISQWARMAPRSLRGPIVFRAYDAMVAEALRWPVLPVALHAALAVQAARGRGSKALDQFERVISLLSPESPAEPARPCDSGIRTASLIMLALAGSDTLGGLDGAANALRERFRPASSSADTAPLRAGWALGDLHPRADAETTALALLALQRTGAAASCQPIVREALDALIAAQAADGGWSAREDEPSAPDVTGAVMEALTACGHPPGSSTMQRAVQFLEQSQHAEAWWRASRGICRLYGTAMALRGLRAAGVDDREAAVLRAGEWLRSIQNADGGWGEHPTSYDRVTFIEAASTPAQTAWALLGLIAGGDSTSESVRRGFAWLVEHQNAGGGWDPAAPTMPGVVYAPYLMDPLGAAAWPLLAIALRLRHPS